MVNQSWRNMTTKLGNIRRLYAIPTLALLTASAFCPIGSAASVQRQLISGKIDESRTVTLSGNTRPEVKSATDLGAVEDGMPLDHMLLQLKRSPENQAAFDKYVEALTERSSPSYHKWLTAEQIGTRFGLGDADLQKITGWLESHGFKVNTVYPTRTMIDFSGTAGQVREAFQTEIHSIDFKGVQHIANSSDPKIPAALASAIEGVVSLHDFRPRPMHKGLLGGHVDTKGGNMVSSDLKTQYTFTSDGDTYQAVVPADLATIYNLNPLFSAGYSGQGQTIVVIEDTNVYSTANWTTFRSTFGLSTYTSGSFTQVHPGSCTNPGISRGQRQSKLLWMPSGQVPLRPVPPSNWSPARTPPPLFGGLIALENLLNASSTPPAIVSISYGECEAENGATAQRRLQHDLPAGGRKASPYSSPPATRAPPVATPTRPMATHGIGVSGLRRHAVQRGRRRHRFRRYLRRHQQHLLELHQHHHLRFGQVLHSGNSLERLLRRHPARRPSERLQH